MLSPQVAQAVFNAAMSLDVDERNILEMHYYDNLSVDEIAVVAHIPRATAAASLNHATSVLRRTIKVNDIGAIGIMQ